MTTILKFYGRPIPANQRNIKLLTLVFYPSILMMSYVTLFLSTWALSDFIDVSLWLVLPTVLVLCFEFNDRGLLPKIVRTGILRGLLALSLYVFWQSGELVKFSVIAMFVTHQLAHLALSRYWEHREAKEAELARMKKG